MNTNQVVCFVAWLLRRGLKSSTINAYLSGLRTIHLAKGFDQPALRPNIVNSIIEGKAHIETIKRRLNSQPPRLPVTIKVLKLLKATLNKWNECDHVRLLIWSVALICFLTGF